MVRSAIERLRHRVRGRANGRHGRPVRDQVSNDVGSLAVAIDRRDPVVAQAIRQRAGEVTRVLSGSAAVVPGDLRVVLAALVEALRPLDTARAWLLLATIDGRLPDGSQVEALVRTAELDGVATAVAGAVADRIDSGTDDEEWPIVRILVDEQLVDVQHTAAKDVATGIQRVTREVARRWVREHGPTLIGWRPDLTAMRALSPGEAHRACWGGPAVSAPVDDPIIVPWRCTYLLPELALEIDRVARLQKMAEHSGTTLNIIGYDLVPMTTAETCHPALVPGFGRNLAAARYARNIAAISEAAAEEYRGWRDMLAATGLPGPNIVGVPLSTEVYEPAANVLAAVRNRMTVGALPLVMVVGTHEPRKNHQPVLHAAELLWREGHQFSLTFVGGHSWTPEEFSGTVERLQRAGRPVEVITVATDDLLWGGYRAARFTVFPSLNEGFGLPLTESLACVTPVITTDFGAMKEIADAGGGALLVDPRDDHSIADAMRTLLVDDDLHAELSRAALARPLVTWDTYAAQVWQALVGA
jgi:glycosyltransferase involved in cell wall biosynthesis